MRHRKQKAKLNRTKSHRRCMTANMLKSLIDNGRIETTIVKAKALRRHADRLITLGKKGTLESRRKAIAKLMIHFNALTPKEERRVKAGDYSSYNVDRRVIRKLFDELSPRYADRDGGYTRIIRMGYRTGDAAPLCLLEYI